MRNLAVSFGGVHAVRDLSFDARAGAITSIIGPNGAGKTTALNAICGFYRPDAGTVKLGEQTVSELRAHQIPRAGIARTYQTSRLFESLSVIDNVLIARHPPLLLRVKPLTWSFQLRPFATGKQCYASKHPLSHF